MNRAIEKDRVRQAVELRRRFDLPLKGRLRTGVEWRIHQDYLWVRPGRKWLRAPVVILGRLG